MTIDKTINIEQLRRQAKKLRDELNIPLMKAQHELALQHGFKFWAEMKNNYGQKHLTRKG